MAAGKDILNQLAKAPPHQKALFLAITLVLVGAGYYKLVYSDVADEKSQLERSRASLLEKQRTLNKQLKEMAVLSKRNEKLQRYIRDNEKALPKKAELPALFNRLQRKAGDARVNIRRWEYLKEEAVDVYIRVPVRIELRGTFYNVMQYFSLLDNPPQDDFDPMAPSGDVAEGDAADAGAGDKTADSAADSAAAAGESGEDTADKPRVDERIISIESLDLSDPRLEDGELKLTAKFIAATFRQEPDEKKDAAKPGAKGGKADKGAKK